MLPHTLNTGDSFPRIKLWNVESVTALYFIIWAAFYERSGRNTIVVKNTGELAIVMYKIMHRVGCKPPHWKLLHSNLKPCSTMMMSIMTCPEREKVSDRPQCFWHIDDRSKPVTGFGTDMSSTEWYIQRIWMILLSAATFTTWKFDWALESTFRGSSEK